jgi:hypothetical protein
VNVFQFTVGDVSKLKSLMRVIRGLDGVTDVERV